VKISTW